MTQPGPVRGIVQLCLSVRLRFVSFHLGAHQRCLTTCALKTRATGQAISVPRGEVTVQLTRKFCRIECSQRASRVCVESRTMTLRPRRRTTSFPVAPHGAHLATRTRIACCAPRKASALHVGLSRCVRHRAADYCSTNSRFIHQANSTFDRRLRRSAREVRPCRPPLRGFLCSLVGPTSHVHLAGMINDDNRTRRFREYWTQLLHHSVRYGRIEGRRHACPCCRYLTLDERVAYEICPLYFWEDDGQDEVELHSVREGSNGVLSLAAVRMNFAAFGACEERFAAEVRSARPDALP